MDLDAYITRMENAVKNAQVAIDLLRNQNSMLKKRIQELENNTVNSPINTSAPKK